MSEYQRRMDLAKQTEQEVLPMPASHAKVEPLRPEGQQLVPALGDDLVEYPEVETPLGVPYKRLSVANAEMLYYIAENDRETGVGMDEIMRRFNLGAMAQGKVALAMKDSVRFGYAELVSPRGDQYRWRVTEKGLETLGLPERVASPEPDAEELKQWAIDMHGSSNLAVLRAEAEEEERRNELEGKPKPLELEP